MINPFATIGLEVLNKILLSLAAILLFFMAFILIWVNVQMKLMKEYFEKIILCVVSSDPKLAKKVIDSMKEFKVKQTKGGIEEDEDIERIERGKRQVKTGRDGKATTSTDSAKSINSKSSSTNSSSTTDDSTNK